MPATLPSDPIVVTGIGLSTGLGLDRETVWMNLRAGRTGLRSLSGFAGPEAGAPALGIAPSDSEPVLTLLDRVGDEALEHAGFSAESPAPSDRTACLIGLSKGGSRTFAAAARDPGGRAAIDLWTRGAPGAGASHVAARHRFQGPSLGPVAACATGLAAVLQGAELLRRDACDVALVGSADASLEPLILGAFRRMRASAPSGGDPTRAIRPCDRNRAGFLVGEGAAVLVIERASDARARGARAIVEIAGGSLGSDAFHETNLNPDPRPLSRLIDRAIERAGVDRDLVDHVNLHGTATRANDPLEAAALGLVFGDRVLEIACSANKAQLGHLLGAAGSVELAIACLAIRDGFVPPTLNLEELDPACRIDAVPGVGRPVAIRAALKLSLGFGGHLAAAILRRPEPTP